MSEREWFKCPDCSQQVLREANGKEYYHSGVCQKPTRPKTDSKTVKNKPEHHSAPQPSNRKNGKKIAPKPKRSV